MKRTCTVKRTCAVILAAAMVFGAMAGCGKNEAAGSDGKKIEGDLQEVMARIYEGVDLDAETKQAMQEYVCDALTAENEQALLGVDGVPYTEGVYSVPMISSIHHLLQDAALSMHPIRW